MTGVRTESRVAARSTDNGQLVVTSICRALAERPAVEPLPAAEGGALFLVRSIFSSASLSATRQHVGVVKRAPLDPAAPQVDLSREASNLRRFNHNFRKTRHVFFPVPLYPLVTPDVLVESFESGEHITAYIQSDNNPYNHRCAAASVPHGRSSCYAVQMRWDCQLNRAAAGH